VSVRDQIRREYEALLPPGLVLGHSVVVYVAGVGQAYRGRVESLDSDAVVRLDRVKWSDAFRVGDRVRAAHAGHFAVNAAVVECAHGELRLRLAGMGEERPARGGS
jgi:hypothetical protein